MRRTPLATAAVAIALLVPVAADGGPPAGRPTPDADPTVDRDPLAEIFRRLAGLNRRPDLALSPAQRRQVQEARTDYAVDLSAWRVDHIDDVQQLSDRWHALQPARGPATAPATAPSSTTAYRDLLRDRDALFATAPDPGPAVGRIRAVLTDRQRRQYDFGDVPQDRPLPAAAGGGPGGAFAGAFGADVLPVPADGVPRDPGFYKLRFTAAVDSATQSRLIRMTYVLFLPRDYRPDGGPYPTLVFMHGSGQNGVDGAGLFAGDCGPAADIRHSPGSAFATAFPMILVCPQCPPRGERWDQEPVLRAVLGVLDEAGRKVRIDPDRVYLTGLSMGGKGTWLLAGLDPGRFAAVAPISSSTLDLAVAGRLRYSSVWAINGSDDIEDGAEHERLMTDAVHAAGGDARLTLLPGRGHDVWNDYYSDPAFYPWFLAHRRLTADQRRQREAATQPTTRPSP